MEDAKGPFFHSWVYVQMSGAAFFVEATTGDRKQLGEPGYLGINCVFNQENYWLSKAPEKAEGDVLWREGSAGLDLGNNEHWVKLAADIEERKRLLVPMYSWVKDLQVCSILIY